MEQVRSFIAIELPEELKRELSRLETRLRVESGNGIKWVNPESIHLTLKFLGYVDSDKLGEILAAMGQAVQGITPFRLEVNGLGAFPNLSRVQVVWVGLVGEIDKLSRMVERIESLVSPLGFPREDRPFAPHLTLARMGNRVSPEDRRRLGQLIAGTRFAPNQAIEVNSVSLMKSELTREGAVYSRTGLVKLAG